jgi:hypothetical protein
MLLMEDEQRATQQVYGGSTIVCVWEIFNLSASGPVKCFQGSGVLLERAPTDSSAVFCRYLLC